MTVFRALAILLVLGAASCHKSGEETAKPRREKPKACLTDEAIAVTHQPGFEDIYTYCTTGSRSITGPATIECISKRADLTPECSRCYSWYKACVLKSCFNACYTPRPEVYCTICRRNSCRGNFYQCAGTSEPFPGSNE